MRYSFLMFIFLFTACITPGMIMKSWVGHRENELYTHWGTPSKVVDNGTNGKIIMYMPGDSKDTKLRFINTGTPVEYITPRNNEYRKSKLFYVTPMGTIYAWKIK